MILSSFSRRQKWGTSRLGIITRRKATNQIQVYDSMQCSLNTPLYLLINRPPKQTIWLIFLNWIDYMFEHLKLHRLTNQWKVTCSNITSMYLNYFHPVSQLPENIQYFFSYPLLLHMSTACPTFLKNWVILPFSSGK